MPGDCRSRWRIASLSACSALVLAAGCGGSQRAAIPAGTADTLARQSDGIAAALERGDRCEADRLAAALVTAGRGARLPQGYRSPLLAAARSLAARIECPPPAQPSADEEREQPEKDKEHGNHGNHGKKGRG